MPPAATTLTALNCEAPVNTSSDIAQAWATEPPAGDGADAERQAEHADRRAEREAGRHDRPQRSVAGAPSSPIDRPAQSVPASHAPCLEQLQGRRCRP